MTILLVRHAMARPRRSWTGRDEARPLTDRGARQAERLVALLEDQPIDRIYSSPATRCIATVGPLARARQVGVEETVALAEGSGTAGALLVDCADRVVLCAHGDNLPELLSELAGHLDGLPRKPPFAKGGTWVLERSGARSKVSQARYLAPPA